MHPIWKPANRRAFFCLLLPCIRSTSWLHRFEKEIAWRLASSADAAQGLGAGPADDRLQCHRSAGNAHRRRGTGRPSSARGAAGGGRRGRLACIYQVPVWVFGFLRMGTVGFACASSRPRRWRCPARHPRAGGDAGTCVGTGQHAGTFCLHAAGAGCNAAISRAPGHRQRVPAYPSVGPPGGIGKLRVDGLVPGGARMRVCRCASWW